jgi:uncharacterized protein
MELRLMKAGDEPLVEQFLANHRDTSMFLRSNIRRAGLDFRPAAFHAIYVGAIRDGRVSGIFAHTWNGMVLVQAPEQADDLARECIKWSARPVTGLTGPVEQVNRARAALGLMSAPASLESVESLYSLNLSDLIHPHDLLQDVIVCRAPRNEERAALYEWSFNYNVETLGASASDETRRRAAHYLDVQIADGNAWVAVENDRPVSFSALQACRISFNSAAFTRRPNSAAADMQGSPLPDHWLPHGSEEFPELYYSRTIQAQLVVMKGSVLSAKVITA